MKLLYEILIIDLPSSQWRPRRPWLIGVTLALLALALALPTTLLARLLANTAYGEAKVRIAAGHVGCGIHIAAVAGRVANRVIWNDLAYEICRVLIGNKLEGCYAA